MTIETYDKATILKNQIASVDRLLATLGRLECGCDPPTRQSSYRLVVNLTETKLDVDLNQGEVVWIRSALESYKTQLQLDFGKL